MITGFMYCFAQMEIPEAEAMISACVCFQGQMDSGVAVAIQSVKRESWNTGIVEKQER